MAGAVIISGKPTIKATPIAPSHHWGTKTHFCYFLLCGEFYFLYEGMSSTFYMAPQCGDIIDILMFLTCPFGPLIGGLHIIPDHPSTVFSSFLSLFWISKIVLKKTFVQLDTTIQWKFFNKLLHSNKHCLNLLKKIESGNMNKHFSVSFTTFATIHNKSNNSSWVQKHLYLISCGRWSNNYRRGLRPKPVTNIQLPDKYKYTK